MRGFLAMLEADRHLDRRTTPFFDVGKGEVIMDPVLPDFVLVDHATYTYAEE